MPIVHSYTHKSPVNKVSSSEDVHRVLDNIKRDLAFMNPGFEGKNYREIYELIKKGKVELPMNLRCPGSQKNMVFSQK